MAGRGFLVVWARAVIAVLAVAVAGVASAPPVRASLAARRKQQSMPRPRAPRMPDKMPALALLQQD